MKSICNFGYARSKKGGSRFPNVKGLLRYIQYRDDRDNHRRGAGGPDRWVDGGLGESYPKILSRLDRLSAGNPHAYCHAVVISPDPQAIAEAGDDRHSRFVEAVKATVEEWETWRQDHDERPQAGPIEYSFVVHRPERNYGEQMHAHLILAPATEDAITGDKTPLYNNAEHVEAFKEIAYRQLDRAFGLGREQEHAVHEQTAEIAVLEGWRDRERPFHEHRAAEGTEP